MDRLSSEHQSTESSSDDLNGKESRAHSDARVHPLDRVNHACATLVQDAKTQIIIDGAKLIFWAAVDEEILRLKGKDCPRALWTEELARIYRPGLSAMEAAQQVLARRGDPVGAAPRRRHRLGLLRWLISAYREWDFQRALRETGRA